MRRQATRQEDGFTLVELMMVVLIIAVLIAIGIPTWYSTRARANETAARSVLTNGHRAVKTALSDADPISTVTTVELAGIEPSLDFNDDATPAEAASNEVSVAVGADYVILATHAKGDGCLAIREPEVGAAQYQRIAGAACPASAFDPAAGWMNEWPPVP